MAQVHHKPHRNLASRGDGAARAAVVLLAALGCFCLGMSQSAEAQTSSLSARNREAEARKEPKAKERNTVEVRGNAVVEQFSWTASKPAEAQTFEVHDLITIVVREQTSFQADAELDTEKKYDITSELESFIKATSGGLGAADFRRGRPNIDYRFSNKLEGEADAKREDRLTTRITGRIVDVKPNGLLVLEASAQVTHDEEVHTITLTGSCRKEDVTADNTVLSTQLAGKVIKIRTEGALKANTTRGWIPKFIDWLKPF